MIENENSVVKLLQLGIMAAQKLLEMCAIGDLYCVSKGSKRREKLKKSKDKYFPSQ